MYNVHVLVITTHIYTNIMSYSLLHSELSTVYWEALERSFLTSSLDFQNPTWWLETNEYSVIISWVIKLQNSLSTSLSQGIFLKSLSEIQYSLISLLILKCWLKCLGKKNICIYCKYSILQFIYL
jgi:hypothetical protein